MKEVTTLGFRCPSVLASVPVGPDGACKRSGISVRGDTKPVQCCASTEATPPALQHSWWGEGPTESHRYEQGPINP